MNAKTLFFLITLVIVSVVCSSTIGCVPSSDYFMWLDNENHKNDTETRMSIKGQLERNGYTNVRFGCLTGCNYVAADLVRQTGEEQD